LIGALGKPIHHVGNSLARAQCHWFGPGCPYTLNPLLAGIFGTMVVSS
jgi:hypothetical protein